MISIRARANLHQAVFRIMLIRLPQELEKLEALKTRVREVVGSDGDQTSAPELFEDLADFSADSLELQKLAADVQRVSDSVSGLSGIMNNIDPFAEQVVSFLVDRLKVQQREAGVRHDLIDAVFALGGEDDLVRLLARVKALQAFVATEDGANLLAGYKRAANILKKEGHQSRAPADAGAVDDGAPDAAGLRPAPEHGAQNPLSYTPEISEAALIAALDSAEPRAAAAIKDEDFEGAMTALATLRAPIDAFFDSVTVNDPDAQKRAARLALLARVRDAVHRVADFSRIEG